MTIRFKSSRPRPRTRDEWKRVALDYLATIDPEEQRWWTSGSLIDLAIDRLTAGNVHSTSYGPRVALRLDLGDSRVNSDAYWPMNPRGCMCFAAKKDGVCSHRLAAEVFRFARTEGER